MDFKEASNYALKFATSLALETQAHLTLLYTYRLFPGSYEEPFERKKKIEENAIKNFAVVENDFLKTRGITYDFKIEVGFVADRVEALCRKNQISFVIVGKDMITKSREAFEELIQNMNVPIIIAPEDQN
jgi:hypothetical protein